MISIEDPECVVYDESGILKTVNELCDYVINNNNVNCIDKIHFEDNDFIVNLNGVNSNDDILPFKTSDIIGCSNVNAVVPVVDDRVDSNESSTRNNFIDYTIQTAQKSNTTSEIVSKQQNKIVNPKMWIRINRKLIV